jgi:hypothetical protein
MRIKNEALPKVDVQRPTVFDQVIADRICERLDMGENLRRFCVWPDWPTKATVQQWAKDQPAFGVKLRKSLRKRKTTAFVAAKRKLPEIATVRLETGPLTHDEQEFDDASSDFFQYNPGDGSRVVLAIHFTRLLAAYKFRGEQLRSIAPKRPDLSGSKAAI